MANEEQNNFNPIEELNRIAPQVRLSDNNEAMDTVQLFTREDSISIGVGADTNSKVASYILKKLCKTISPAIKISIEHLDKPNALEVNGIEMPLSSECSAAEFAFSVYDFYTTSGDSAEQVIQADTILTLAILSYLKSGKHTLDELVHHCAEELNINNLGLFFKGITELPYEGNPDYQVLDTIVYANEKKSIPDVTDKQSWYANDFVDFLPEMFIDFVQEKKTGYIMPELSKVYVHHHSMCSFFPVRIENNGTLTSPFTPNLRQSLETLARISLISDYSDPDNYIAAMNALEKVETDNLNDSIILSAVTDMKNIITAEYSKAHRNRSEEQENVQYVTLDDLINKVRDIEARTEEPRDVTEQIWQIATAISEKAINSGRPIKVLTDYDADGICFAYILDKTLHKLNPDIDLEVICNDRRGSYGIPKNIGFDKEAIYIIGDMGCNELSYIEQNFGEHFVIDHHIFEDEATKARFNSNANLLNPQSLACDDGKSADYCATGLSYRVCQSIISAYEEDISRCNTVLQVINQQISNHSSNYDIIKQACLAKGITLIESHNPPSVITATINNQPICNIEISGRGSGETLRITDISIIPSREGFAAIKFPYNEEKGIIESPFDEKFRNTIDIIAGIGTVADCVNVLDTHSMNRAIIKNAMQKIDNATQTNIEYILGCILAISNIGLEDITSKQIAFSVAPFFNAPSRMSPIIEKNGAQLMYDTLASENSPYSQLALTDLNELNIARKRIKSAIKDENYYAFIEDQRCGEGKSDKIAIYLLSKEVPHTMCGIIASGLSEACDKPAIVFTPKVDAQTHETTYIGSARNIPRMTSLKAFLDHALSHADPEQLKITYGGHEDAVGISSLNDINAFEQLVKKYQSEFKEKDITPVRLALKASEISSPETLQKILSLEPLGQGFKLPPVVLEGKEERRTQLFKSGNPHWKTVRMAGIPDVTDWDYSPFAYPTDKSGIIRTLAELEISDYNGRHIEAKAVFSQTLLAEREMELGITPKDSTKVNSNHTKEKNV